MAIKYVWSLNTVFDDMPYSIAVVFDVLKRRRVYASHLPILSNLRYFRPNGFRSVQNGTSYIITLLQLNDSTHVAIHLSSDASSKQSKRFNSLVFK